MVTFALVGKLQGIPSEKAYISFVHQNYKYLFPNLCDRTKCNLSSFIKVIRNQVGIYLDYSNVDFLIVDRMPTPVCAFGRIHFIKCFK